MIRKLDCSVYYNNRTEKLLKLINYLFYKNFENVPYKIVFSRCQIRVQESARMHDFVPFSPELPQTPCRTATALCAVGQPAKRVEGPLHVVEGY
jgi:hypothetical protein